MKFIRLNKTNIYVEEEEIIYKKDKQGKNGVDYYRCSEKGCFCRGKVINEKFHSTNDLVHFHRLHNSDAEYHLKLNELKAQVMSQKQTTVRKIYRLALRDMNFEMSGRFDYKKVRHGLQRLRRKQMPPCPDLQTMISLLENNNVVRKNYGMMRSNPFYQGTINDNILVFANLEVVEKLPQNIQIYVDATFKVCPFKAYQLIIVMAEVAGSPRPIIYGIMPGKEQKLYETFFHFIKHAVLIYGNKRRKPISAMADFERGLRNAIIKNFPNIQVLGCNFHHVKALKQRARKTHGLSTKIFKNSQHHFILKCFMRISLLPINRIDAGLEQLKRYIASMPDIASDFNSFITYYESTWFWRYDRQDWSVSDAFRRTNNNIEGLNSYIKKLIPRHPSPYEFLDRLLDLSYETSSSLSSALYNVCRPKDRSKLTAALREYVQKLNNNEISELRFLKALAKI